MSFLWVKYKSFSAVPVFTENCLNVALFIKAVKKELQLPNPPQELLLSLTDGGPPLRPGLVLTDLSFQPGYVPNDDENPLIISVLESSEPAKSPLSTPPSPKPPHPTRKRRWDELNEVIQKKQKGSRDSIAYSSVYWNDVKDILAPGDYEQASKKLPELQFKFISQYLEFATRCFGPVNKGKEAQRLHLIAPIIICVCILFDGDIKIDVEADLKGEIVKAHGHFEFILHRGKKTVCIVEAKRNDMFQGMAQDLLGCEVAADRDHLDVVYGIVTTYMDWNFLRSSNECIKMEECKLKFMPSGAPTTESLLTITGKIYGMLSDD